MATKRVYCVSCTLVPVRFESEYCDACVQDIIDYLEEDEAVYLSKLSLQQEKIDYSRQLGFDY